MERIKKALQLAGQERAAAENGAFTEAMHDKAEPAQSTTAEAGGFAYTQTRVLDSSPDALERNRIVSGSGQDGVTHAYKQLRTQVLQRLVREDWQTVAIVSPRAGEGKTLTAINLAVSLANSRSHTSLLVDLDWRQPSVHTFFGYDPVHDVCDYLRGEQPLESVIVNPGLPRFCFLPCRQPIPSSSEQLAGLGGFVKALKARYRNRVILFDLPPLLATDDALSFVPLVDCTLLVVEEGKTKREDIARCLELLDRDRLLGTVVNRSNSRPQRY